MNEVAMIRVSAFSQGARFDKVIGSWRMDKLNDFLESYITEKLEKVGMWSQQKLAEVKKYIMIKIFDSSIKDNPFDKSNPYLVNFVNGTYNMKTDTLTQHNPKDYIFQSHPYKLPSTLELPIRTLAWLDDLTGSIDSSKFLLEFIGYCFFRSYEPFQMLTILKGNGGNGKSCFLNFLMKVFGESNISNATLQDLGNKNNRFVSSQLYQKEVNIFADIDNDFISSTGLLKALTGCDTQFAEFKGQDPFMFKSFAKLLFSANDLPSFNDFTLGWERRLYVVPFSKKIDDTFKQKHNLSEIEKEIPHFAYYSMTVFMEALKRGELTQSEDMENEKEKWLKESNHILRFIQELCDVDMESDGGDSSKLIYETYQDFCYRESLKEMSQPKFSRQLEQLGIYKKKQSIRGTRIWRYSHLSLKCEYTQATS